MKRRNFLKSASAVSAPFLLGGIPIGIAKPLGLSSFLNGNSDRKLVLIQLNGGNDGLNTVMQLSNYDVLANLRSNILIPENQLLNITDEHALHPSMTGIHDMYDQGMVQIVQNVAYPNQNRSHFRSTDIWTTASSSDEFLDTGWLGRYMTGSFPGYPNDFPNEDCPDPLAITIGNFVSETCQGETTNFSIAVGNLDEIRNLDDPTDNNLPDNCYGHEMEFLIESIRKSNAYATRLTEAADAGANLSTKYIDGDGFSDQLMTTARLISGGLQTQVYIVSIGGFDTHATQVEAESPELGTHASLLERVSNAVCAFFDDLKLQGLDDNVLCMTFSEFGRQIRSNGSLGTDHGTAAPVMIFGNCLAGGVMGDNIEIPPDIDPQTGVPMQFDFRDVYGTILDRWFSASEDDVKNILYEDYERLNIFSEDCFSSTSNTPALDRDFQLWPNPARDVINIKITADDLKILGYQVFNNIGAVVAKDERILSSISLNTSNFAPGQYFVRMRTNNGYALKQFIKI